MEGRKMTKHAPNMTDKKKREAILVINAALQKATTQPQKDALKEAIRKLKEDLGQ